jgi:hypothetical protein
MGAYILPTLEYRNTLPNVLIEQSLLKTILRIGEFMERNDDPFDILAGFCLK